MRVHARITIDGEKFILAEKIADYRTASLAQAEYRGAGVKCRKWPVPPEGATHVGSAIMDDGFHVFHLYETTL